MFHHLLHQLKFEIGKSCNNVFLFQNIAKAIMLTILAKSIADTDSDTLKVSPIVSLSIAIIDINNPGVYTYLTASRL